MLPLGHRERISQVQSSLREPVPDIMAAMKSAAATAIAYACLTLGSLLAASVAASNTPVDLKIYGCHEEKKCPHELADLAPLAPYDYPHVSILNFGTTWPAANLQKYKNILKDFAEGQEHWEPNIKGPLHGPKQGAYQVELCCGDFGHHSSTIEALVKALEKAGISNDHGAKGAFAGYHISVPAKWVDTNKKELHDKHRQYLEGKTSNLKWYLGDTKLGVFHPLKKQT